MFQYGGYSMKLARHFLAILCLFSLFSQPIMSVPAEIPVQAVPADLRFEYALAELAAKSFDASSLISTFQSFNGSHFEVKKPIQAKAKTIKSKICENNELFLTAAAYQKDPEKAVDEVQKKLTIIAKDLSLKVSEYDNKATISKKVSWIEKTVKNIVNSYKHLKPTIKENRSDKIWRLVLLNHLTKPLPLESFSSWPKAIKYGLTLTASIAGGLAWMSNSDSQSNENSATTFYNGLGQGIGSGLSHLATLALFNKLQTIKKELLEKDEQLKNFNASNQFIKKADLSHWISYNPGKMGFKGIQNIQDQATIDVLRFYVDWLARPVRYFGRDTGRKAITLYGEPGNGKGTLTKAIADEAQVPIITVTSSDLSSQQELAQKLGLAEICALRRKNKSVIVLFDEIDLSTGDYRNAKNANGQAMQQLLTTLDGIKDHNPHIRILYVFATNFIQNLDPRMLRPGRIQHKIYVGPPNEQQRAELFKHLVPGVPEELVQLFAQETEQLSRVAIESIVTAVFQQATFEHRGITEQDFLKEIHQIKESTIHKSKQIA